MGLRQTPLLPAHTCPFFSLQIPLAMGDSNVDASATVSETVAEEVSLFSMTDMILFSLIVGLLTYWFLFRKKKDEIPEFTRIQPV